MYSFCFGGKYLLRYCPIKKDGNSTRLCTKKFKNGFPGNSATLSNKVKYATAQTTLHVCVRVKHEHYQFICDVTVKICVCAEKKEC